MSDFTCHSTLTSLEMSHRKVVIPAKAGIQAFNLSQNHVGDLDPRLRGDDKIFCNSVKNYG